MLRRLLQGEIVPPAGVLHKDNFILQACQAATPSWILNKHRECKAHGQEGARCSLRSFWGCTTLCANESDDKTGGGNYVLIACKCLLICQTFKLPTYSVPVSKVNWKLLVRVSYLKMSALTARADFYEVEFDPVSFLLNDVEGFGIWSSRRSVGRDERSLVLITDLGVSAQLAFCLQSIGDLWKLRSDMHWRYQKMTACHLTVVLNGNVYRYGKFAHFISIEHTQQKTLLF